MKSHLTIVIPITLPLILFIPSYLFFFGCVTPYILMLFFRPRGSEMRIRIQDGHRMRIPCGSGSETLPETLRSKKKVGSIYFSSLLSCRI
jgi:hypothetical protein